MIMLENKYVQERTSYHLHVPGPMLRTSLYLSFNLHMVIFISLYRYENTMERANQIRAKTLSWPPLYPDGSWWVFVKGILRCPERMWASVWLLLLLIYLFIHSTNIHSSPTMCQALHARNTAVNKTDPRFCLHEASNLVILMRNCVSPQKILH